MAAPTLPVPTVDVEVAKKLHLGGGARIRRIAIRVLLIAGGLALAFGAVRWWQHRGQQPAPSYLTAPIGKGELAIKVTATGTLEARNQVQISSEVSGKIRKVLVDANDHVTVGQPLAEIDPEPYNLQVEQAGAALAQARAQRAQALATRKEARQTLARVNGLVDAGVDSEQDRDAAIAGADRAQAAVALADAAVEQATAALSLAHTNLKRTVIRAPIDGVVLERVVEVGQTVVAAFQSPVLFQIAEDLRAMKVSVDVDEADVGMVENGQTATFTVAAYLGRSFDARVVSVHNAARLVDRVVTYEAELDVDNRDLALRPGMTVTAEILAHRIADALLVPSQALRFTPAGEPAATGDRIWVLRDGKPVAVPVTIAGQNDVETAIAAPDLAAGDAVIVNTSTP